MSDEKPEPQEAPNREVAVGRMAMQNVAGELEKSDFLGGATSVIRDDEGKIEAVANVAVGWRAEWLWQVMGLLNDATEKAVSDLRRGNKQGLDDAVKRAARDSQGEGS